MRVPTQTVLLLLLFCAGLPQYVNAGASTGWCNSTELADAAMCQPGAKFEMLPLCCAYCAPGACESTRIQLTVNDEVKSIYQNLPKDRNDDGFQFCYCAQYGAANEEGIIEVGTAANDFQKETPRFEGEGSSADLLFTMKSPKPFQGEPDADNKDLEKWATGVIFWLALAIFFMLATSVFCLFCVCCRRCCNTCGGSQPHPAGYTKKQQWIPFAVLCIAAINIIAFASVGWSSNGEVTKAFVSADESFTAKARAAIDDITDNIDTMEVRVSLMIDSMKCASAYANYPNQADANYQQQLDRCPTGTPTSAQEQGNEFQGRYGSVGRVIDTATDEVSAPLRRAKTNITGASVSLDQVKDNRFPADCVLGTTQTVRYPEGCDLNVSPCQEVSYTPAGDCSYSPQPAAASALKIAQSTETSVGDVIDENVVALEDVMNTVKDEFFDGLTEIIDSLDKDFSEQITEASDKIRKNKDDLNKAQKDYMEPGDSARSNAMQFVLALPVLVIAIAVLGGIFKKGFIFSIAIFILYFGLFFVWLLFGLHMTLSVGFSDVCVSLNNWEANSWTPQYQNGIFPEQVSDLTLTCFRGGSLLLTYNVSKDLAFEEQINKASDENADKLDSSSFDLTEQSKELRDSVNQANSTFTLELMYGISPQNVSSITALCPACAAATSAASNCCLLQAKTDEYFYIQEMITARSSWIGQSGGTVTEIGSVSTAASGALEDIAKIGKSDGAFRHVYKRLDDFKQGGLSCSGIGDAYKGFKSVLCESFIEGISKLAMAFFFVGLFSLPLMVTLYKSSKRLPHPEGWMSGQSYDNGQGVEMAVGGAPIMMVDPNNPAMSPDDEFDTSKA